MKYYTIREVAVILRFKERTIRQWIRDGKLKASKYDRSGKWFISDKELSRKKSELEK